VTTGEKEGLTVTTALHSEVMASLIMSGVSYRHYGVKPLTLAQSSSLLLFVLAETKMSPTQATHATQEPIGYLVEAIDTSA
jgi:hypothetical protein